MFDLHALVFSFALALPPVRQAPDPCSLLTLEEIQAQSASAKVPPGIAETVSGPMGVQRCRYEFVAGKSAGKYTLTVTVSDAAKAYPGATTGEIKMAISRPAAPTDPPAIMIQKTGDGAYYKSGSAERSQAVALVKGSVVEVTLDGPNAGNSRRQTIELLRAAVARL